MEDPKMNPKKVSVSVEVEVGFIGPKGPRVCGRRCVEDVREVESVRLSFCGLPVWISRTSQ
jgi:hypothetical protein